MILHIQSYIVHSRSYTYILDHIQYSSYMSSIYTVVEYLIQYIIYHVVLYYIDMYTILHCIKIILIQILSSQTIQQIMSYTVFYMYYTDLYTRLLSHLYYSQRLYYILVYYLYSYHTIDIHYIHQILYSPYRLSTTESMLLQVTTSWLLHVIHYIELRTSFSYYDCYTSYSHCLIPIHRQSFFFHYTLHSQVYIPQLYYCSLYTTAATVIQILISSLYSIQTHLIDSSDLVQSYHLYSVILPSSSCTIISYTIRILLHQIQLSRYILYILILLIRMSYTIIYQYSVVTLLHVLYYHIGTKVIHTLSYSIYILIHHTDSFVCQHHTDQQKEYQYIRVYLLGHTGYQSRSLYSTLSVEYQIPRSVILSYSRLTHVI